MSLAPEESKLNDFLERYAQACEARRDTRTRYVRHVGTVSIADAVRMLKVPR